VHYLNHRQILAFRAVMIGGGMTAAGRILHISQPAVTRLVRDLEQDLDLVLFNRKWSGVQPTAEAIELFREVEKYVGSLERVRDSADQLKKKQGQKLRIAAMSTLSVGALPEAIRRFRESYADTKFFIHSDNSVHILDALQRDEFSLGLCRVPPERSDLEHLEMPVSSAVCLLPKTNPLARRDEIRVEDLDGEPFISLGVSSLLRMQIEAVMERAGVRPGATIQTLYSNTVSSYVSSGLGISVTDVFSIMRADLSNVVVRPFTPDIPFRFSAVFPRFDRPPQADAFATMFHAVIDEQVKGVSDLFNGA